MGIALWAVLRRSEMRWLAFLSLSSAIEPTFQKRVTGIEPVPFAWEANVLPLYYTREFHYPPYMQKIAVSIALAFLLIPSAASAQERGSGSCDFVSKGSGYEVYVIDDILVDAFLPVPNGFLRLSAACQYRGSGKVTVRLPYKDTRYRPFAYVWNEEAREWEKRQSVMNRVAKTFELDIHQAEIVTVLTEDSVVYEGIGSWYAHPKTPAGAATNLFPLGTPVKITNIENGKTLQTKITSTWTQTDPRRIVDIEKQGFAQLGNLRAGLIRVTLEMLDEKSK